MGTINKALKRYSVTSGGSLENPANWVIRTFGAGTNTASGISVDEKSGLQAIDVMTCVRIISETIAQLPLITYKEKPQGGRERSKTHPLYSVLQQQANEEMTAFTFKETMQAHLLTWGNAYAWIDRNDVGDCDGLYPLLPDRTQCYRKTDGSLWYRTTIKNEAKVFPASEVFHIPGLGFDGLTGYSVISLIREQIGLAMAQEEYAGRFYGNGATPPLALTHPQKLQQPDIDRLEADWKDAHGGVRNAWRMALLDQGMELKTIGIPQQDAQFIESRKFSSAKIAGFYRVPANMLGATEAAGPYGVGKEQDQINFRIFTIMPWAVRWEHAIDMKLLLRPRDRGYYVKFLMDGLERGDFKSRMEGYAIAWGKWMTTDEIRGYEEQNPYEAPADEKQVGKMLLWPLNMGPAEKVAKKSLDEPKPVAPGGPDDDEKAQDTARDRRMVARAQRIALADVATRILQRETNDLMVKAKKKPDMGWLDALYDDHRDYIAKHVGPVLRSYAALIEAQVSREVGRDVVIPATFVVKYIDGYAQRHVQASLSEVRSLDAAAMPDTLATWATRSEWIASREAAQAGNAFARAAYRSAGIQSVTWMAGDECADCAALHGKAVVPDGVFGKREDFKDARYVPASGLGHPPHCDGCECVVVAAPQTYRTSTEKHAA